MNRAPNHHVDEDNGNNKNKSNNWMHKMYLNHSNIFSQRQIFPYSGGKSQNTGVKGVLDNYHQSLAI
eukprot:4590041-Ditylum_brightwellii.AAC.1